MILPGRDIPWRDSARTLWREIQEDNLLDYSWARSAEVGADLIVTGDWPPGSLCRGRGYSPPSVPASATGAGEGLGFAGALPCSDESFLVRASRIICS